MFLHIVIWRCSLLSTSINPNDIAERLLRALDLRARRGDRHDILEYLIPGPDSPEYAQGYYAIFPPRAEPSRLGTNWLDFWRNIGSHAQRRGLTINTPCDQVIGETINTRLQGAQPYEFQAEAIMRALSCLDPLRNRLRRGMLRNLTFRPRPEVIGVIAPTGAGKTEIFEAIALQLALDARQGGIANSVLAYIIYSMRAFMRDHFQRFMSDIAYITLRTGRTITIGIWDGDTPNQFRSANDVLREYEKRTGSRNCPICSSQVTAHLSPNPPYYRIQCRRGHDLSFIRLSKISMRESPPDILLVTPEQLNFNLLFRERHMLLGRNRRAPPILLIIDEPHSYTGVFGSQISALIREFEFCVNEYARRQGLNMFRPLKIATSATIPNPEEFLAKLFTTEPQNIHIIHYVARPGSITRNKGFLFLMPERVRFGFQNAIVELPAVLAAILPRNQRRILVFTDSVELANRLKYMIEDYIRRPDGFVQDYDVVNNIGTIFANDLVDQHGNYNPNFARVAVHYGELDAESRREVEDGFRSGAYNIVIATPTLELGIDIGEVHGLILIGIPPTPEKFAQRVGRAGRRRGVPALIITIGNPSNTVDRWYFSDERRIRNYLHTYIGVQRPTNRALPLNPANLEVLRRYFGNHICIYCGINNVRRLPGIPVLRQLATGRHRANVLNTYMQNNVMRIYNSFINVNYPRLQQIALFIGQQANNLRNELDQRVSDLANYANNIMDIQGLRTPDANVRLGIRVLLGYEPSSTNLRCVNPEIALSVYIPLYGPRSSIRINLSPIDVARAYVRYCYTNVGIIATPRIPGRPIYQSPQSVRILRGSVSFATLRIGGQTVTMPLEVAGVERYNVVSPRTFSRYYNIFRRFATLLNIINNHCVRIDNILMSRIVGTRPMVGWFDKVRYVLSQIAQRSIPVASRILIPYSFILEPLNQVYKDAMGNVSIRFTRRQPLSSLPYVEFLPPSGPNSPRLSNRLSDTVIARNLRCSRCGGRRFHVVFDRRSRDLIFICNQCGERLSYRQMRGRVRGGTVEIDEVRTYVRGVSLVDTPSQPIRQNSLGYFTLKYYRNARVLLTTALMTVKGINTRHTHSKYIGRKSNPNIMLYELFTDALELEIDWFRIDLQQYQDIINSNVYRLIGARADLNDFKLRVTHSLSHLILNMHPLITGGNRWDVSEYLDSEVDRNGNIVKTKIIIHDTDEGGNGICELIGYFLRDIIWEAYDVCVREHQRAIDRRRMLEAFLGAPGDVLIETWPFCPLCNIALSRAAVICFLRDILHIRNRSDLDNIIPQF